MNVAIIAAAGQGTRMDSKRAKQFLELAGIPIIIHTLKAFERCDAIREIVAVLPEPDVAGFATLASKHGLQKLRRTVPGGATRAASVLRGLEVLDPTAVEIVAVHDGSRPFVTPEEIARTVKAAESHEAAILVAREVDTVKEVSGGAVVRTVKRDDLRRALTPQCFRYSLLRRAYENVDELDPDLTDESSLVERLGVEVTIVEGSSRNIKITTREDLIVAEAFLKCGL
jgi:2-C-methyl-D-erythritol 4-phosphate cytidylyltransferase